MIDLDSLPPCICGGQLSERGGEGLGWIVCPSCGWEYDCDGPESPTMRTALWTRQLAAEVERLRGEHDERLARDARIHSLQMTVEDGEMCLAIASDVVRFMADCMIGACEASNAPNYLETTIETLDGCIGGNVKIAACIVRPGGFTPHELRRQAEAERDEARAEIARLRGVADAASAALAIECELHQETRAEAADLRGHLAAIRERMRLGGLPSPERIQRAAAARVLEAEIRCPRCADERAECWRRPDVAAWVGDPRGPCPGWRERAP